MSRVIAAGALAAAFSLGSNLPSLSAFLNRASRSMASRLTCSTATVCSSMNGATALALASASNLGSAALAGRAAIRPNKTAAKRYMGSPPICNKRDKRIVGKGAGLVGWKKGQEWFVENPARRRFAPKGLNSLAQGNALGAESALLHLALKGHNNCLAC